MPIWPNDYIEKVLKDVEKYDKVRKPVKAGLIERCITKYCSPKQLHPNPADEFSQNDVGPNFGIVGKYVDEIKYNESLSLPIFKEPIIVQKMEPEGYLLINGHHRWFAAMRMGTKKIHVKVVNLVSEDDVERMIAGTVNDKLASFDLDEVLLTGDAANQAELRDSLFSRKYKERLRKGVPEVIKFLQERGYDVAIYTAGYFSEDDINDFFSMYDIKVNIIINGFNEKRRNNNANGTGKLKTLIEEKYKKLVHIDNAAVLCTNRETKEFEDFEIDAAKNWEDEIVRVIG